jgi:hypothetical protein
MATGGAETSRQGSVINPGTTPAPANMLALIPEEFLSRSFEATVTRGRFSPDHSEMAWLNVPQALAHGKGPVTTRITGPFYRLRRG